MTIGHWVDTWEFDFGVGGPWVVISQRRLAVWFRLCDN